MHIATKSSKIDISSKNQLEEFARNFGENLKQGDVFFLFGEIGVGKTTFVKYLINNLQFKFNQELSEITSPTFNLLNEYQLNNIVIKHYDLFRLKNKLEIYNLDLFENNKNIITLIEWPQLIDKEKSIKAINLTFRYENDLQNRSVKIEGLN